MYQGVKKYPAFHCGSWIDYIVEVGTCASWFVTVFESDMIVWVWLILISYLFQWSRIGEHADRKKSIWDGLATMTRILSFFWWDFVSVRYGLCELKDGLSLQVSWLFTETITFNLFYKKTPEVSFDIFELVFLFKKLWKLLTKYTLI